MAASMPSKMMVLSRCMKFPGRMILQWNNFRKFGTCLRVLGIETSCDDTGAAVVDSNGNVLGECLNSQQNVHLANGGIIPPIAKELHKEHIERVIKTALKESKLSLNEVDAIAATVKPGLELSLIIGLNYAKKLVRESRKLFIPIHHMEAHALTARMVHKVDFPFLVLLISGGHCQIAVVKSVSEFFLLGNGLDDAPGEAFDKTARRLKLRNLSEYQFMNGGKAMETLALSGDPLKFHFPSPLLKHKDCNFSFAGIKAWAVRLIMEEEKKHELEVDKVIPSVADFCASFQHAVVKHLVKRIHRAMIFCDDNELLNTNNKTLVVSGGVGCNKYIRGALQILCNQMEYNLIYPPPKLCTDNGIMIAWNGVERLKAGIGVEMNAENIEPSPKCPLGVDLSEQVKDADIKTRAIKLNPEIIRKYAYETSNDLKMEKTVNV